MSLTLDVDTKARLDRARSELGHEFGHLSADEVNRRFDAIAHQLLTDATFADFVPVLTWRYTREALRTMEGIPAEFRTEPYEPPASPPALSAETRRRAAAHEAK